MKLALATVATLATTSAWADGLPTISFGGDLDANYATDAERMTVDITPELSIMPMTGLELEANTKLALYDEAVVVSDTLDVLPTINFEATYSMSGMDSVEWYAKTSYNFESSERGELHVGATFSF